MLTERLSTATRYLWRSVSAGARNVLTLRNEWPFDGSKSRACGLTPTHCQHQRRGSFGQLVASLAANVAPHRAINAKGFRFVGDRVDVSDE